MSFSEMTPANSSSTLAKEALIVLLKECQSRPDAKIEAQGNKALALIRLKRYVEARATVKQIYSLATREEKKLLDYYNILAWALEGNEKEAIEILNYLEKQYPSDILVEESYWILMQNCLLEKKFNQAKVYLTKLEEKFPQGHFSASVQSLKVQLNQWLNAYQKNDLQINQRNIANEDILALAKRLRDKDPLQAVRYCDMVISAKEQNINLKIESMWLAGEILEKQKEYAKAAGYFEMIEFFFSGAAGQKALDGLKRAVFLYEKAIMNQEAARVRRLIEVYAGKAAKDSKA